MIPAVVGVLPLLLLLLPLAGEQGLYRRIWRSDDPVSMYVPGDAEYATAWIGPNFFYAGTKTKRIGPMGC